jgi:hypothetical protein
MSEREQGASPATSHPELEQLAAFLDGALSPEDRAEVEEHLSHCEDCYTVFSESARFQLEHDIDTPREELVLAPLVFRRKIWMVGALAAAALALCVGIWVYRTLTPPPRMGVAALIEPLDPHAAMRHLWTWREKRSLGEESSFRRISFQFGALATDLRISMEAGDREHSVALLEKFSRLLQSRHREEEAVFHELAQRVSKNDPRDFLHEVERIQDEVEPGLNIIFVSLGKWSEAGRIAAAAGNAAFFRDRVNRRFLSQVQRQPEVRSDFVVRQELKSLEDVWDKPVANEGFGKLKAGFNHILDFYDPR